MIIKNKIGAIKGNNLNITKFCYILFGLDLFKKFHDHDLSSDDCFDSSSG
jgi:hypothetical protein